MLKINHCFFVKPVLGPRYFFVRRQGRDFAKKQRLGMLHMRFLNVLGALYMLEKIMIFRETCFWTLVLFL